MSVINPFDTDFDDYPYDLPEVTPVNDLDLEKITKEWLQQCGPHDYGIDSAGCNCPPGDPRPVISQLVAEIERLRSLVDQGTGEQIRAFVGWFQVNRYEEPEDGSLILRDENRVYVRTDPPAGQPLRTLNGHPMGDWYLIDGTEDGNDGPLFFGEVMGLDDPECDRQHHSYELLYTADDIARLANEFLAL